MSKILKHGVNHRAYVGHCDHCRCEFECVQAETVRQAAGEERVSPCPECGKIVTVRLVTKLQEQGDR